MKVEKEKEGILLESGTNEIEIMKFTIQGEFYGIKVSLGLKIPSTAG